jgi:flagellar basal-body rod modification protein FlgD
MPEIGRPITPQEMQYRQVQMAPTKQLGGREKSEAQIREDIINKATGRKPTDSIYKEGPHNQMGKDEFLKLLTFQLQNQDPMNPMDQGKFTGELAQFSQLEQLASLNSKFDKNHQNQAIQDKFYAASFVGKKVVTHGSTITLKNSGDAGDVLFKTEGNAAKVMVRILDEKNNVAAELWQENLPRGSHQITWDGVALDGAPAVKGNYHVQVKAWDEGGKEVGTATNATGIVQSVTFDEGEPVLTVNGQKVYLRDVASFHTADAQTHANNFSATGTGGLKAAQATNSDLSERIAPMIQSKNTVSPSQAMNAYEDNAGIYD